MVFGLHSQVIKMKAIIITLALIVVTYLMTFDASVLYSENTAFLFEDDIQALFHFVVFAVFSLLTKNIKLSIIAAISFELLQLFIPFRSFQMIDLLSNIAACYVAETLFLNHKKHN